MPKVIIDGMRHGDKKEDSLTPEGFHQVMRSAKTNLAAAIYTGYFCSNRQRAYQTAEAVMQAIGDRVIAIEKRAGFDYPDELITTCGGGAAMNAAAKKMAEDRGHAMPNIEDWSLAVPDWVNFIRPQVAEDLQAIALVAVQQEPNLPIIHLFVGSHSPVIELACPDMAAMPRLQEADIVRYVIDVDRTGCCNWKALIESSKYIPRGF